MRPIMTRWITSRIAPALLVLSFIGCAQLQQLPLQQAPQIAPPDPPKVAVSSVALVAAPTNVALAMYFCPQIANVLICRIFGPAPALSELVFVFDVTLTVENDNPVPLPAVETMLAFTAYPDANQPTNAGVVCLALCPEGQDCGPPPEDGCSSADEGLKTKEDYAAATAGLLVAVAMGTAKPSDIKVRTIPPGASIEVLARLELEPQSMLQIVASVARDALREIEAGRQPNFAVPFALEGTLWVEVESFGKIAAGFGPFYDTWSLQ